MLHIRKICATLFFVCSLSSMAWAEKTQNLQTHHTPKESVYGELWSGSLYTSTYKAGVCLDPQGNVQGVLILRLKNGDEDVYHFKGTKDIQGLLSLKHKSGHSFKGYFESATSIKGKVKTKNGFTVKLQGERQQNVLLGDHCRPL